MMMEILPIKNIIVKKIQKKGKKEWQKKTSFRRLI